MTRNLVTTQLSSQSTPSRKSRMWEMKIQRNFELNVVNTLLYLFDFSTSIFHRLPSHKAFYNLNKLFINCILCVCFEGATSLFVYFEKKNGLSFLHFKLFQSFPSSAILVLFCFRINPLVFFSLWKPLFLGFSTLKPQKMAQNIAT